jgi:chromosome segregation ATPase
MQRIAADNFKTILMERSFAGHLEFDNTKKTLELFANPPNGPALGPVESLSGGEKAYVLAAFLGAMWEKHAVPFRVLDEIECFMVRFTQISVASATCLICHFAVFRRLNARLYFLI